MQSQPPFHSIRTLTPELHLPVLSLLIHKYKHIDLGCLMIFGRSLFPVLRILIHFLLCLFPKTILYQFWKFSEEELLTLGVLSVVLTETTQPIRNNQLFHFLKEQLAFFNLETLNGKPACYKIWVWKAMFYVSIHNHVNYFEIICDMISKYQIWPSALKIGDPCCRHYQTAD